MLFWKISFELINICLTDVVQFETKMKLGGYSDIKDDMVEVVALFFKIGDLLCKDVKTERAKIILSKVNNNKHLFTCLFILVK